MKRITIQNCFDESSIEADDRINKPNRIIATTVKKKFKSKKGLIILINSFLFFVGIYTTYKYLIHFL